MAKKPGYNGIDEALLDGALVCSVHDHGEQADWFDWGILREDGNALVVFWLDDEMNVDQVGLCQEGQRLRTEWGHGLRVLYTRNEYNPEALAHRAFQQANY